MKCEECMLKVQEVYCHECEEALCGACDALLHKGGKRKFHIRPRVCQECGAVASTECNSCSLVICSSCAEQHKGHVTFSLSSPKRIGVFWDLSSCRPDRAGAIGETVSEITQRLGRPEFVKTYGDPWQELREACLAAGAEPVCCQNMKETDVMLLDLSLLASSCLTHIILISGHAQLLKPHLLQLRNSLPNVKLLVSSRVLPLDAEPVESLRPDPPTHHKGAVTLTQISELTQPDDFQSFASPPASLKALTDFLRAEARVGNVMHDVAELLRTLRLRFKLSAARAAGLLEEARRAELVLCVKREFADGSSFEFASLRLVQLSLEGLLWTLRSLRLDEMLPTEKSIQARMKEAFDLKPSTSQWNGLVQKARGHAHSHSAPVTAAGTPGSLPEVPRFEVREMFEPGGSGDVMLIYPKNEEWVALDQHSKYGDFLGLKLTDEWDEFLRFIRNFFAGRAPDQTRSIPGGRYGCAQFLKLCGPLGLRQFSLGRLSYLVQLAINDDILRYQRTFLIFTEDCQKTPEENELHDKLMLVQKAIAELLSRNPEGLPLAQIPYYLKRLLSFPLDIAELGFPKLKDLLVTVPGVGIELRGNNQPFAVLSSLDPEEVLESLYRILKQNPFGLLLERLEDLLMEIRRVNWRVFRVNSLREFIEKFARHRFDIIPTLDTLKVFLSNVTDSIFSPSFQPTYGSVLIEQTHMSPPHTHSYSSGNVFEHVRPPLNRYVNLSNVPELDFEPEIDMHELSGLSSGRNDSIQFHSNRNSFDLWNPHSRTQSETFAPLPDDRHRHHNSCIENWEVKPPPGFEDSYFKIG